MERSNGRIRPEAGIVSEALNSLIRDIAGLLPNTEIKVENLILDRYKRAYRISAGKIEFAYVDGLGFGIPVSDSEDGKEWKFPAKREERFEYLQNSDIQPPKKRKPLPPIRPVKTTRAAIGALYQDLVKSGSVTTGRGEIYQTLAPRLSGDDEVAGVAPVCGLKISEQGLVANITYSSGFGYSFKDEEGSEVVGLRINEVSELVDRWRVQKNATRGAENFLSNPRSFIDSSKP